MAGQWQETKRWKRLSAWTASHSGWSSIIIRFLVAPFDNSVGTDNVERSRAAIEEVFTGHKILFAVGPDMKAVGES